ncbi:MAG: glycosyltransferase [Bacteroidetes bacterium]|nr:glycosyltransferase [Bacteroidota bacterium]
MLKRKKIIYFVSSVDFSYGIKWLAEFMPRERYDVTFFFLFHQEPQLVNILKAANIDTYYIPYRNKYDLLTVIPKIFRLLLKIKPDVVHAHLFDACIASLIPAYLLRVPMRVHTRHHSMIHHDSFPHAIKYDKLNNFLSHKIIAISQNVLNILIEKEKVPASKATLLHHGFNFDEMLSFNKNKEYIPAKYNLKNNHPIIGVISRFTEFKGIQYIIPAFKQLLTQHPNTVLIMANAVGDYKTNILEMCADMDEKIIVSLNLKKMFLIYMHALMFLYMFLLMNM